VATGGAVSTGPGKLGNSEDVVSPGIGTGGDVEAGGTSTGAGEAEGVEAGGSSTGGGTSTVEGVEAGGNSTCVGVGLGVEDSRTSGGGGSLGSGLGVDGGNSTVEGNWVGRVDGSTVGPWDGRLGPDEGAGNMTGKEFGSGGSSTPLAELGLGAGAVDEAGAAAWATAGAEMGSGSGIATDWGIGAGSTGPFRVDWLIVGAGSSTLASWIESIGALAAFASANEPGWATVRPFPWATTLGLLTASRNPCWACAIPFLSAWTSVSLSSFCRASTALKKLRARAYSWNAR
jgi:hypothetical protein